jgi:hypothetical protein
MPTLTVNFAGWLVLLGVALFVYGLVITPMDFNEKLIVIGSCLSVCGLIGLAFNATDQPPLIKYVRGD